MFILIARWKCHNVTIKIITINFFGCYKLRKLFSHLVCITLWFKYKFSLFLKILLVLIYVFFRRQNMLKNTKSFPFRSNIVNVVHIYRCSSLFILNTYKKKRFIFYWSSLFLRNTQKKWPTNINIFTTKCQIFYSFLRENIKSDVISFHRIYVGHV